MAKLTKRAKLINEKVEAGKLYAAEEAFTVLKDVSTIKFVEAVDVAVILGVDPRKSDQAVRGATGLPRHGYRGFSRMRLAAAELRQFVPQRKPKS